MTPKGCGKPSPEKGVATRLTLCYRVEDGKIVEVFPTEREATFRISAPYGIWVDISTGKLGANKALMTRKLKAKGNFMKLPKYSDGVLRWIEILKTLPTEFEGQYAQLNRNDMSTHTPQGSESTKSVYRSPSQTSSTLPFSSMS